MWYQGLDIKEIHKAVCWVSCITCWSWSLDTMLHSERQGDNWYLNSTFPTHPDLPGEFTRVGGKEYLLHVPLRQRLHGDLHKTTLLPGCLGSYKTLWFDWEMCISTQAQAARKVAHFHVLLTCLLSTHESLYVQGRPKQGNTTENHRMSQPSPVSPACTQPHTFECRIFCRY